MLCLCPFFTWLLFQSQLPLRPKGVASLPISRWKIQLDHFFCVSPGWVEVRTKTVSFLSALVLLHFNTVDELTLEEVILTWQQASCMNDDRQQSTCCWEVHNWSYVTFGENQMRSDVNELDLWLDDERTLSTEQAWTRSAQCFSSGLSSIRALLAFLVGHHQRV